MTTSPAAAEAGRLRIGDPVRRFEDRRFLTGRGRYVDDQRLPGELALVVLRSPHPAARIVALDAEAARAMPGVRLVLTSAEEDAAVLGTFSNRLRRQRADGTPMFEPPRHLLARGAVRHVGEAVAAIVADSEAVARDAAERIAVEWDPLPAAATLDAALAPDAPAVWAEQPDNRAFVFEAGDRAAVEAAFARAHHVTRVALAVPRIAGNPMEPRSCLAQHDPDEDRYTLHVTTQTPHSLRQELAARILRIPPSRLRVVAPDVGGAFGLRGSDFPEYGLCLWAARLLGRPVRWRATRSESFLADHQARDNLWQVALALDAEGNFLALQADSAASLGHALAFAGTHQATNNLGGLAGPYRTPAIHVRATGVFTHAPPVAPYRGAGRPEATYAIERAIDIAAAELGLDRVALRRRNLVPSEAMPFRTGLVFTYDSGDFPALLELATEAADWAGFPARRAEAAARGRLRGIGIAFAIEIAGGPAEAPFEEHAAASLDAAAGLVVRLGTHSHGQGHETAFRQIASDRLGIRADAIRIVFGDTDAVAHGRGTYGSRSIGAGGTALLRCLDAIIDKARLVAAVAMEAAPEDVTFADGRFAIAGTDRALGWREVADLAYRPAALPRGIAPGLVESATLATQGATFPNSAHVCEVEIDPETGALAVCRYLVADDIGRVVNPLLAHGQVHGGVAQGLGEAICERILHDGDGQLLTGSFMDYAMPRAADLPAIVTLDGGVPTSANALGAKGAGEAGAVGAPAALVGAAADALGLRHLDMPLTAETIWRALRHAKATGQEKADA